MLPDVNAIQQAIKAGLTPALAYDRISDEVQADGISLSYQKDGAREYARQRRLFIVRHFTVVESASKQGRKVFAEMLDLAQRLGIKHLVFKNTDRMSRNYHDLARIESLIEKQGFEVHLYQTQIIINKNSSYNDRFLIGIQLAVAKHLSDKISQDVREHNQYKSRQGIAPGPSPIGYKYDRKAKHHVIDPDREQEIRYIFDEFDSGRYTLDELVLHLNERGLRTHRNEAWRKSNLHHLLTNPFYCGEFRHRGVVWCGRAGTLRILRNHASSSASKYCGTGPPAGGNGGLPSGWRGSCAARSAGAA